MRGQLKHWSRNCPDCQTEFSSVQANGICPNCDLVFAVRDDGQLIRRIHRLGDPPEPEPAPLDREKNRIKKLLRFVDAGKVYDHEMFENILYQFVSMPNEFWEGCANLLNDMQTELFCKYIDDQLTPVDFEPSPIVFMAQWDPLVAAQKKQELKPKYEAIHKFWHDYRNRRIT